MTEASRLKHLARILSDLAASLEAKLASVQKELRLLCQQREELAESLRDGNSSWALFYSDKLRGLLNLDVRIAVIRQHLDTLQVEIRDSRRRAEAAQERAVAAQSGTDRREEEREILEVALSMQRRAPDKHGVMK